MLCFHPLNALQVEQGGDLCPVGTYCGNGTATPLPCLAGTYNDLEGQEECFACPAGYYCEANATAYDSTPCPAGWVQLSDILLVAVFIYSELFV